MPALGGVAIRGGVGGGLARRHVERRADAEAAAHCAHGAHRLALREADGVRGAQERVEGRGGPARGRRAVAERREDVRLVEDDPVRHAVGERLDHRRGVVGEAVRGVAVGPAAGVLERLRQVPVVERREGPDAGGEERVAEPAVVVEPFWFARPRPIGWMRGQAIEKR